MKTTINIALLLLFFIPLTLQAQFEDEVRAIIKIEKSDISLDIYAYVENQTDKTIDNLNYSLFSLKETTTKNQSQNKQSGGFTLLPKEVKILSKQSLSDDEDSIVSINLSIKKGLEEIATDILQIGEKDLILRNNSGKNTSTNNVKDVISRNITTSIGKDFFKYFNQISGLNKNMYSKDVVISENYSLESKNTEISVHSNNRLIYKFRTLAKKDYLYAAAQESIKRLKKFYINTNGDILAEKSSY